MSKSKKLPESIEIKINGETFTAELRTFSTGSKGYYLGGIKMPLAGERLQVGCNLVFVGSKDWN